MIKGSAVPSENDEPKQPADGGGAVNELFDHALKSQIERHQLTAEQFRDSVNGNVFSTQMAIISAADLRKISRLPVTTIDLFGCEIDNASLADLSKMHLTRLNLGSTNLDDTGARFIGNCNGLIQVKANDTKVTDQGLASLAKLPRLEQIDLHGLDISDTGLAKLVNLKHLVHLPLNGTRVTTNGVRLVCKNVKTLQTINLSKCSGVPKQDYNHLQREFRSITFSDVEKFNKLKQVLE